MERWAPLIVRHHDCHAFALWLNQREEVLGPPSGCWYTAIGWRVRFEKAIIPIAVFHHVHSHAAPG